MFPNHPLGFPFPSVIPFFPPSSYNNNGTNRRNTKDCFNDLSILCSADHHREQQPQNNQQPLAEDSSSYSSSDRKKSTNNKRKRGLFCKESYLTCQSNSQLYSTIQVADEENILFQLNNILNTNINEQQTSGSGSGGGAELTILGKKYIIPSGGKTSHLYRLRAKLEVRRGKRLHGHSLELFDIDHILQQFSLHSQNNHFKHHVVNSDTVPCVLKVIDDDLSNTKPPPPPCTTNCTTTTTTTNEIVKKEALKPVHILPKKILPKPQSNNKQFPKQQQLNDSQQTTTQPQLPQLGLLPFHMNNTIHPPFHPPFMFLTSSTSSQINSMITSTFLPAANSHNSTPANSFKNTFNTDIQIITTTTTNTNEEEVSKRQKIQRNETIIPFSQKLLGSSWTTIISSSIRESHSISGNKLINLFKEITKGEKEKIPAIVNFCRIKSNYLLQINSLLQRCFWPNISVEKYLVEQPERTVVALYKHLVIGFGAVTNEGYIHYLVVMPQFRQCGIGSILMEELLLIGGSCRTETKNNKQQNSVAATTEFTIHIPLQDKNTISFMKKRFGFNSKTVHRDFFKSLIVVVESFNNNNTPHMLKDSDQTNIIDFFKERSSDALLMVRSASTTINTTTTN